MWTRKFIRFSLLLLVLSVANIPALAQNGEATAMLEETAHAMGGVEALHALINQVLEGSGQQFEPEQALRPGGQARRVADFRYTLTREIASPRLRLEWNGRTIYPREVPVRYIEIIDGDYGLLQESIEGGTSQTTRLHPGRLASRIREEQRSATALVLTALGRASLTRLPDTEVEGLPQRVLSFDDDGEEFQIYLDVRTKLLTQVDILEHDPIYGDSRYTLRYADWQSVDGIMVPFDLRHEINGKLLQSERLQSVRHNVELSPETFLVPEALRRQDIEGEPTPSQWLLRRLAMNVSYLDFGRDIPVEFVPLADGVIHIRGTSHNSVLIEFQDHLVVVEAPLYEERSESVLAAIRQRFPTKPIRYVIPTHFHNDHSGGTRTYTEAGATIVAPAISAAHYERIARAPHTIRADRLEQSRDVAVVEGITEPKILTDGSRQIEIYPYATSHADDYQIIYLPGESILIEADHVSPREGGSIRPGELPRELLEGIEALNLNVQTIVGIHGDVGTYEDLRNVVRDPAR